MISVVIPAYNEEKMIAKTTDVICGILKDASIAYELVFVDDGSKDGTWKEVQKASEGYPGVRGISFSRIGDLCGAGRCKRGMRGGDRL